MKYLYKQTGVIVESESNLDSAIFTPVKDVFQFTPLRECRLAK